MMSSNILTILQSIVNTIETQYLYVQLRNKKHVTPITMTKYKGRSNFYVSL